MFEYLEPEASDNQETNPEGTQGTGSLPLSSEIGGQGKGTRSLPRSLNPEKVRHLLYGSRAGIDRTIKILHAYGYADPNDWSDPIPVPPSSGTVVGAASPAGMAWMVVLTKTILLE